MARNDIGYDSKAALPNKLILDNGTVTDIAGTPISESTDLYKSKPALPNKLLNPDGSYSTLNEIIGSMIDTNIFILVDELPETGEENKIYVVPNEAGTGFNEYMWNGVQWNSIGMIEFDINAYYTREETEELIAESLDEAKEYVDTQIEEIDVGTQVFHWNGQKNTEGLNALTQLYELNQKSDIIFMWDVYNYTTGAKCIAYLQKGTLNINSGSSTIYGYFYNEGVSNSNLSWHGYYISQTLRLTYQNGSVTNVTETTASERHYLDTNTDYRTPYVPLYDGSPATKKYVDDAVGELGTQVFQWNGNTEQEGLDFWNEVWQAQKTVPCIILYGDYYFHMYNQSLVTNVFYLAGYRAVRLQDTPSGSLMGGYQRNIVLTYDYATDTITAVSTTENGGNKNVLATHTDYSSPYEPQYPGSPATKKYVDERASHVFYWGLGRAQADIDLWNMIYQMSRENDVSVVTNDGCVFAIQKGRNFKTGTLVSTYVANIGFDNTKDNVYYIYHTVSFSFSEDTITTIYVSNGTDRSIGILSTAKNYSSPYEPQYPGSPATKKYVDDSLLGVKPTVYTSNTAYTAGTLLYSVRDTDDLVYLFIVVRNYTSTTFDNDLATGNILRVGIPNEIYDPANATYDDLFNTASNIMETSIESDVTTVNYTTQEQAECYTIAYNILTGENPPR